MLYKILRSLFKSTKSTTTMQFFVIKCTCMNFSDESTWKRELASGPIFSCLKNWCFNVFLFFGKTPVTWDQHLLSVKWGTTKGWFGIQSSHPLTSTGDWRMRSGRWARSLFPLGKSFRMKRNRPMEIMGIPDSSFPRFHSPCNSPPWDFLASSKLVQHFFGGNLKQRSPVHVGCEKLIDLELICSVFVFCYGFLTNQNESVMALQDEVCCLILAKNAIC